VPARHAPRLALDIFGHDLRHGRLGRPIDIEGPTLAAALDQGDHGALVGQPAIAALVRPIARCEEGMKFSRSPN